MTRLVGLKFKVTSNGSDFTTPASSEHRAVCSSTVLVGSVGAVVHAVLEVRLHLRGFAGIGLGNLLPAFARVDDGAGHSSSQADDPRPWTCRI
jgi:hypothetical protein